MSVFLHKRIDVLQYGGGRPKEPAQTHSMPQPNFDCIDKDSGVSEEAPSRKSKPPYSPARMPKKPTATKQLQPQTNVVLYSFLSLMGSEISRLASSIKARQRRHRVNLRPQITVEIVDVNRLDGLSF